MSTLPTDPRHKGLRVLITGGAGFLGRALLGRAVAEGWPWEITVYSRDETKQDECRRRYPEVRYVLGDVNDTERLTAACWATDALIHAAALKYIPEAEGNPAECVRINVDGARSVIAAARRAGVPTVVGISTDKAVRPINAYGQSKALMERLFAEASYTGDGAPTRFQTVRYGNVVGSTGSVIPFWCRQLREEGRITLTDPRMTRFFMSPDAAVDCVLHALAPGRIPGSVTVPRPQAMRMGEMAALIAGEAVTIMGIRPGEKLSEDLAHVSEPARLLSAPATEGGYYELLGRPYLALAGIAMPDTDDPPTLASHTPAAGWVTADTMSAWMEEAAHV